MEFIQSFVLMAQGVVRSNPEEKFEHPVARWSYKPSQEEIQEIITKDYGADEKKKVLIIRSYELKECYLIQE